MKTDDNDDGDLSNHDHDDHDQYDHDQNWFEKAPFGKLKKCKICVMTDIKPRNKSFKEMERRVEAYDGFLV